MPRPNVFPEGNNKSQKYSQQNPYGVSNQVNEDGNEPSTDVAYKPNVDEAYNQGVSNVVSNVYGTAFYNDNDVTGLQTEGGQDALRQMQEKTQRQLAERNAQLQNNQKQSETYQTQMKDAETRHQKPVTQKDLKPEVKQITELKIPTKVSAREEQIRELSAPQFNTNYDLIPLPSGGKIYPSKKASVKVSYMTTADENILSSPNLLESGEFLEILINRKLLDNNLRYKDLHIGDRNAIMIWLRATAYGYMYPVTLLDENNEPFETEIDLSTLKSKPLGDTPDENGEFDFFLPVSKSAIKFKLLTVGDLDYIERLLQSEKEDGILVNNEKTYKLEEHIVEIDGNRDPRYVRDFVNNMRPGDSRDLLKHIDKIESGVELELEVKTPGGGSIKAFFPLNLKFFWPDFGV
jgi:hypothetical protein